MTINVFMDLSAINVPITLNTFVIRLILSGAMWNIFISPGIERIKNPPITRPDIKTKMASFFA